MPNSTAPIFQNPDEVTEGALRFLHPVDIAKFSQTCRAAHALIYRAPNQYLWRELFLLYPFDDPRHAFIPGHTNGSPPYNWKVELQQRVRTELLAFAQERTLDEQQFVFDTIISVIWSAAPVRNGSEFQLSNSLKWVARISRDSSILDVPRNETNLQSISRIRTYLLQSLDRAKYEVIKPRVDALRSDSRWYTYNVNRYRRDNNYGPYLVGGQIDWFQVKALTNVIRINLMELCGVWVDTRPPVGLEATRAYSVIGAACRAPADWACVEGTWRRVVCFLDYRCVLLTSCSTFLEVHAELYVFSDLFGELTFLFAIRLGADYFSVAFNASVSKRLWAIHYTN
jgi:hypothetical protein